MKPLPKGSVVIGATSYGLYLDPKHEGHVWLLTNKPEKANNNSGWTQSAICMVDGTVAHNMDCEFWWEQADNDDLIIARGLIRAERRRLLALQRTIEKRIEL